MKNPLARKITYGSLIGYALPTVAMMFFMAVYTIVDSLFVSILIGTDALAAVNIVYPFYCVILATGAMLAAGGSAIVAREMGKGENVLARKIFTFILLIGFAVSLIFAVAGFIFADQILVLLGARGVLEQYSYDYYIPLLIFLPSIMLQILFEMFFITAGHPKRGLVLIASAGITNVVLDYYFIAVLEAGISGAALATGIGSTIPAFFGLIFFLKKDKSLYYDKPLFSLKVLLQASFNGASEMVIYLATGFSTLLLNWMALSLIGVNGVAAVAILLYSEFLLNAVFYGFAHGLAPIISYNFGRGDSFRLRKIIRICITLIGGCSLFVFLLANAGAGHLVGLFASGNPDVFEIAYNGFLLFSFCFLFMGFNIYASALFTALSNGKLSAIIAFLRTFFFMGLGIMLLPRVIGANGLWLALPVAEALTLIIATGLVAREYRSHLPSKIEH